MYSYLCCIVVINGRIYIYYITIIFINQHKNYHWYLTFCVVNALNFYSWILDICGIWRFACFKMFDSHCGLCRTPNNVTPNEIRRLVVKVIDKYYDWRTAKHLFHKYGDKGILR